MKRVKVIKGTVEHGGAFHGPNSILDFIDDAAADELIAAGVCIDQDAAEAEAKKRAKAADKKAAEEKAAAEKRAAEEAAAAEKKAAEEAGKAGGKKTA
jgi:colicin import membrane protein